jgi:hypothetical protein
MKRNILSIVDRKMLSRETNFTWLAFFRMSIGLYCLVHFLAMLPDINMFLAQEAIIAPDILNAHANAAVPTLYKIANLLGYDSISHTLVYTFATCYIVSLVSLVAGLFTRISAILAAVLHLTLLNSIIYYVYGVDYYCTIALFYCIIFPVGKFVSLDAKIFRQKEINVYYANFCLLLLQVHICIAYFFGGFDKVLGYNWWNGESIWKAVHLLESPTLVNLNSLPKWVFVAVGWGTIVVEMLYPVFANIKKTRKLWLALVIAMHLSIMLFIGLFFFSTFMILFNLCCFYAPYAKNLFSIKPANNFQDDHSLRLQM